MGDVVSITAASPLPCLPETKKKQNKKKSENAQYKHLGKGD